ncbi:syntaxin-6-like [Paramacrobiotus metropolitanus]|uniref:syntaxin-6-like n=1 Tax=Paramacrobiotus metropolitanus TaxID=2943436 RepID=UPI002446377C|nr:syntaxin-6-like [Paramacrobiotus metropolitanus]
MDTRASKSGVGDMDMRRSLFGIPPSSQSKGYTTLPHDDEEHEAFLSDTLRQQQQVIRLQDDTLDKIGSSVGVLKDMSEKIGMEVSDHMVIMDDLGDKMERTDGTMTVVMRKLQKVSRLSDDRSQWWAIGVLLVILLIILILFAVL